VVTDAALDSLAHLERTVLRAGPGGVVHLGDVATVSRSTAPQWSRVTADGRQAVLFQVYQQPAGNTVQIAQDIQSRLAAYRAQLPADV